MQVHLTLTAANVVTEWNHDLGGFAAPPDAPQGPFDPKLNSSVWFHNAELYNRWLQAGIFQPIFRTHIQAPGDSTPWHYPNFPALKASYLLRAVRGVSISVSPAHVDISVNPELF